MERKHYKNYLFDLYGTLVDIHTDEENEALWEKLCMFYGYYGAIYSPKELQEHYLANVKKRKGQESKKLADQHEAHPEIELEYVFKALFMDKGIEVSLEESIYAGKLFRTLSTEYIRLYEGAKELLQTLKTQGKKIYLLSNAQSIFTRAELTYLGIDNCFDDIFISSEYGCKKPDETFYRKPLEKYGLNTQETIMIGNDYICDILGAQQVGLDTFYIHSNLSPDLEQEIKSTYYLMHMDLKEVSDRLKDTY